MENVYNFTNSNYSGNKIIFKKNDLSRDEYKNINEEHILSLRKKRNNKYNFKNLNLAQMQLSSKLDINIIINCIKNDELYIKYKNSDNELEKINFLMQMII